jgi:uncharacterized protein YndB with AHSA1/START domain
MSANNARINAVHENPNWDLAITRMFDAPRDLVFKAWTDPNAVAQWWGPNGFTNPVCELDVRVGGAIRIHMRAPDGVIYPMTGTFEEVDEPHRLVFISSALDANGNSMFDNLNTVTFEERRGKTAMTLTVRVINKTAVADQYLKGMDTGWSQTLDRLHTHLSSMHERERKGLHLAKDSSASNADREIVTTRTFDARRDVVWKMWTDRDHVAQWWGPNGFTTTIQEMNVRAGGTWRLVMRGPDGRYYNNHIVYHEVHEPEKLVYEHLPEKGSEPVSFITTVIFTPQGNKTLVSVQMLFPSAKARDHVVKTYGAIEGLSQTLGRLEAKLVSISADAPVDDTDFVFTRVFDAPRAVVFKAWTEPERLAKWWGPKGWEITVYKADLRPSGVFHYRMQRPQAEMWGKFAVQEVTPPERLVFVNSFSNENADTVPGPFDPNFPLEILNTVTFEDVAGKTKVKLHGHPINATEIERKSYKGFHISMDQGFGGTFDKLEAFLRQS